MSLRIKVIFDDGEAHIYEVESVTVEEKSAIILANDVGQIVLSRDDSDEKW